MDADAVNVEGYGHNIGWDDCSMDILPEMNCVYRQHFQPSEDTLGFVLKQSQSYLRALAGRESFAGFLNVSLMSDILVKRTEVIFDAPSPCVLQSENGEASTNISWLDVVKAKNYQAEHTGNGVYHFHMRDRGVIVQLSTFQHNMLLSGLPRKLVQPWSYEKDVQMEMYTLALAAEMTSLMNQFASEVIKANNTVLEEIAKRDQALRHSPLLGQRSATTPFSELGAVSVGLPAHSSPAQADTDSLDEAAVETRGPGVQSNTRRRCAAKRSFSKNQLWCPDVLKQFPEWFEDQVRRNLSQEEIARNFEKKFKQKRTFNALEAKLYKITGKSSYRKRGKQSPVPSTTRKSSPSHQSSGASDLLQQMIMRSNMDVHTLYLSPSIVPYLAPNNSEDGNPNAHTGAQPTHSAPESNGSNPYDLADEESECLGPSRGRIFQSGESSQVDELTQSLPSFSGEAAESPLYLDQSENGHSIHAMEADPRRGDSSAPRESPPEARRIKEPIRSHTEDNRTPAMLGQMLLHSSEVTPMHMDHSVLSQVNRPAGNDVGQCTVRESQFYGLSAHKSTGHDPEDSLDAFARATASLQASQSSATGSSTEGHSLNRMNGPSTDTLKEDLAEEELIRRCVLERSQAQVRPHRPWKSGDLNRLPQWLMVRKHLPKNKLEVEFLRDFGHYRTSCAISTACRKIRKAEARQKNAISNCTSISLSQAIPGVVGSTQISRTSNNITGNDTPGLNPSHMPSKELHAPENSLLERPRSPQTQPQIPDCREGSSSTHSALSHDVDEAMYYTTSAAIASTCAPPQTAVSQRTQCVENTSQLGNQKEPPPARFTAVNGGKGLRARSGTENTTPQAQMEREGRGDLQGGQRTRQTSTPPEGLIGQELNSQNGSQRLSPQTLAEGRTSSLDSEPINSTLEATGDQPYIPAVISDTRTPQPEVRPTTQNSSQTQANPVNIPFPNNPQPDYTTGKIQNRSSAFQIPSPRTSQPSTAQSQPDGPQSGGVSGMAQTDRSYLPPRLSCAVLT
ncbi:uncharacterized protein N7446_007855 [Penicillium canescens]|uniref:Uncharacterized protein n=1 Tax=Penicillium canescens TaxID=5083 RepID=A0AAD6IMC9_PENCN|nr:uncharacterized protein N7446_007855 [Penicillium canescens]KAJ6033853.1 hypothetical protein N7444_011624 [Penicillium canescens]KAJ6056959.1 hypothetical protein N7460_000233 [Penicillium canescens]KAJ6058272.1 hypothetical protein N7446_007855 [Penicillium canescens]